MGRSKPLPHGLRASFVFSRHDCKTMISQAMAGPAVKYWSSIDGISEALVKAHGDEDLSAKDARNLFTKALRTIRAKNPNQPSLALIRVGYEKELKEYQKQQEIANLKRSADQEGYISGLKFTLAGTIRRREEIEEEMADHGRKRARKIDPGAEPSTTSSRSSTPLPSPAYEDSLIERDDLPTSEVLSVGTIIKRAGARVYRKFIRGEQISLAERKLMTSGLSSALDFIDSSREGQISLFQEDDWQKWEDHFTAKYRRKKISIPSRVLVAFEVMARQDNGSDKARQYLCQMRLNKNWACFEVKLLSVFDILLNLIDEHQAMLQRNSSSRYTESDYLGRIWLPLLDCVLGSGNRHIRAKSGESVSHHTVCAKQRQYADADNVIAFKFNIRFVYDMEDEEYDLGAAEIARMPPDDDKIIRDQGKLVREGKETVDMITRALCGSNANAAIASCIMPFCGTRCHISSIRLARPGFYVAIPQRKFSISCDYDNLSDAVQVIEPLLCELMEENANFIKTSIQELEDRRLSFGQSLGQTPSPLERPRRASWTRPTWFSPPRVDQEVDISTYLERHVTPELVESVEQRADDQEPAGEADNFGWVRTSEGKWHNTLTGVIIDVDPYNSCHLLCSPAFSPGLCDLLHALYKSPKNMIASGFSKLSAKILLIFYSKHPSVSGMTLNCPWLPAGAPPQPK
ncbi:hypothetical protein VTP01DRAFT_9199 [Rhizomucor pusillus]|uniref:uncharacterized protein n=1 Tax=Rhizomucor pusillus TaxID=4840 RepID=UPI00374370E8